MRIDRKIVYKTMKYVFAIIIICLFFNSCRLILKPSCPISIEDKKTIVRLMLEGVISGGGWFDYRLKQDNRKVLILSTRNLDKNLVPSFPGVDLILLSPGAIQKKADEEGMFMYLAFGPMNVISADTVAVSLSSLWALGKKDKGVVILSGGGRDFYWIRENDVWINRGFSSWRS